MEPKDNDSTPLTNGEKKPNNEPEIQQPDEPSKENSESLFVDSQNPPSHASKETFSETLKKHKPLMIAGIVVLAVVVVAFLFGTKTICFHDWKDATCTEPKTCSNCGKTEGEALGHKFGEYETTVEATCAEVGSKTARCEVCGELTTREIPKIDHTPGKWEVDEKPSINSDGSVKEGTKVKKCTVCGEILDSQTYTMSAKEIKSQFVKGCKEYSYKKIFRNPDTYKGKQAKFTGKVLQVRESSGFYILRVATSGNYDNVIYVTYSTDSKASRILEDDRVTIYGTLTGLESYEAVSGATITIPRISAEYIDVK